MSITCFSIFLASECFLKLTALKLTANEKLLVDSLEEAYNKNIPIYTNGSKEVFYALSENKHLDSVTKKIMRSLKSHKLNDDTSKYRDGVILMIEDMVEATINLRSDLSMAYGSFETNFPSFCIVQIFEQNSPYIIVYSKLNDQLLENGVDAKWSREAYNEYMRDKRSQTNDNEFFDNNNYDETDILTLLTVLFTGWSLAILVFIGELVYVIHLKKFKKLYYNKN